MRSLHHVRRFDLYNMTRTAVTLTSLSLAGVCVIFLWKLKAGKRDRKVWLSGTGESNILDRMKWGRAATSTFWSMAYDVVAVVVVVVKMMTTTTAMMMTMTIIIIGKDDDNNDDDDGKLRRSRSNFLFPFAFYRNFYWHILTFSRKKSMWTFSRFSRKYVDIQQNF